MLVGGSLGFMLWLLFSLVSINTRQDREIHPYEVSDMAQHIRFIWAAFLLFLPITSFPFFPPAFGGEALVRPALSLPLSCW